MNQKNVILKFYLSTRFSGSVTTSYPVGKIGYANYTFKECNFKNVQIENATIIDSYVVKAVVTNKSTLINVDCKECTIDDSNIIEGSDCCTDCTIANTKITTCKVRDSWLYYCDIKATHLLDCKAYRGNCLKCHLQNSILVNTKLHNCIVYDSEIVETTVVTHSCVFHSSMSESILKESVYFNVEGTDNKTIRGYRGPQDFFEKSYIVFSKGFTI